MEPTGLPARLLVVDTGSVLGQGLETLLGNHPDIESVRWTSDVLEVAPAIHQSHPNVVVLEIGSVRSSSIELISQIGRSPGSPAVVVLCDSPDRSTALTAFEAGAAAIVSMAGSLEDLLDAIRAALHGAAWLPANLLRELVIEGHDPRTQLIDRLTRREQEVLNLLLMGLDRRAIASRLFCSRETVRTHIQNIMSKLDAHSTIEVIAIARQSGLEPV